MRARQDPETDRVPAEPRIQSLHAPFPDYPQAPLLRSLTVPA